MIEQLLRYGATMGPVLALERAGVGTMDDLTRLRRKEVQKIRGIGKKAMDEIDGALKRMGLWYREEA